jgi:hypothetical protein
MAYATAIRFASVGCYLPDAEKVEEIVGQKFRPNVLNLYPWMAEMIQLGKTENASGKTVNRKQSSPGGGRRAEELRQLLRHAQAAHEHHARSGHPR